jgi:hypothetical protein
MPAGVKKPSGVAPQAFQGCGAGERNQQVADVSARAVHRGLVIAPGGVQRYTRIAD